MDASKSTRTNFWMGNLFVLALIAVSLIGKAETQTPVGFEVESTNSLWNNRGCIEDTRGKWFRDAKFGAFIHFGLYSELGGYYHGKGPYDPAEQIMGLGER